MQALKTAAYAATAAWVGGVAQLIPWLGWLIGLAAAIYSVYLLYLGLPHTMKAPADRAAGYTAVAIIVAIVLGWILWAIIWSVIGRGMCGRLRRSRGDGRRQRLREGQHWRRARGMGEADGRGRQAGREVGRAERGRAVSRRGGRAASAPRSAAIRALPRCRRTRSRLSCRKRWRACHGPACPSQRNAAMGFEVAEANADYSDGAGRSLRLEINDTGGAQGLLRARGLGERRGGARVAGRLREDVSRQRPHGPRALGLDQQQRRVQRDRREPLRGRDRRLRQPA